jgi:hypothetical protein
MLSRPVGRLWGAQGGIDLVPIPLARLDVQPDPDGKAGVFAVTWAVKVSTWSTLTCTDDVASSP